MSTAIAYSASATRRSQLIQQRRVDEIHIVLSSYEKKLDDAAARGDLQAVRSVRVRIMDIATKITTQISAYNQGFLISSMIADILTKANRVERNLAKTSQPIP
jgi:hypothetical protein